MLLLVCLPRNADAECADYRESIYLAGFWTDTDDIAYHTLAAGDSAIFLAAGWYSDCYILDVSEPARPRTLGRCNVNTEGGYIVGGRTLYAQSGRGVLTAFDVSNPAEVRVLGSVVLPYAPGDWPLNVQDGMALADSSLLVLQRGKNQQPNRLLVIDVSDPSALRIAADVAAAGKQIAADGARACIVGDSLWVLDLSDPSDPRPTGSVALPSPGTCVALSDNHAWVEAGGLQVVDYTDPAAPRIVGSSPWEAGRQIVAEPGRVWGLSEHELRGFDVSDPSSPRLVGRHGIAGSASGILVQDGLAHVAVASKGLCVFNIFRVAPTRLGPTAALRIPFVNSVTVDGSYAFCTNWRQGQVEVLDISDPAAPTRVGSGPYALCAVRLGAGSLAVADVQHRVLAFDVSNPGAMGSHGWLRIPAGVDKMVAEGACVYVVDRDSTLSILDFSDPAAPRIRGRWKAPGRTYVMAVRAGRVYLPIPNHGLRIIDVSDPDAPRQIGSLAIPSGEIVVSDAFAMVATQDRELIVVDVSDPANPRRVESDLRLPLPPSYLCWVGSYLYVSMVASQASSFSVYSSVLAIDVRDPSRPRIDVSVEFDDRIMGLAAAHNTLFVPQYDRLSLLPLGCQGGPTPPVPFGLTVPEDGARLDSVRPTLRWRRAVDPDPDERLSYTVYWSTDSGFTEADSASGLADTSVTLMYPPLEGYRRYTWKVRAYDQHGGNVWSDPPEGYQFDLFDVSEPPRPSQFALVSPVDSESLQTRRPVLTWRRAADPDLLHTILYTLQWAAENADSGGATVDSVAGLSDTTYVFPASALAVGRWYRWRVRASHPEGAGRWCSPPEGFRFHVIEPRPLAFALVSPADSESLQTRRPVLTWRRAADPDLRHTILYTLQWAAENADSGGATVDSIAGLSDTTYAFPAPMLAVGHWYRWRVRASHPEGAGRWCSPPEGFRFYVPELRPLPFALVSPADGQTLQTPRPVLTWRCAADPEAGQTTRYTLQWAAEYADSGGAAVDSIVGLSDTTHVLPDSVLTGEHWYRWRVRAKYAEGVGRWCGPSEGFRFYVPWNLYPVDVELEAEATDNGISLRWRAPSQTQPLLFLVHRRAVAGVLSPGDWVLIAGPLAAENGAYQFADFGAEPGILYEYEVAIAGSTGPESRWGPVQAQRRVVSLRFRASPNPGPAEITLSFGLPQAGDVIVRAVDVEGRLVAEERWPGLAAGGHARSWRALDSEGRVLRSGTYWLCLVTPTGTKTLRWTLIR